MAELRAPEQNRLLGQLARMLRTTEGDIAAPEFLPKGLDVMGLVRQLMLPSAETVEKLSYGDPLFRMPTQSNIPITADREYLADVVGMAPMVPAASRATTRLSNEAADQLVRAITGTQATAPQVLEAAGQMLPMSRMISPEIAARFLPETKAVDEAGKPVMVYTGSQNEIEKFNDGTDILRVASGWFTDKPKLASAYAVDPTRAAMGERAPTVYPSYLDIKNPVVVDAKGANWDKIKIDDKKIAEELEVDSPVSTDFLAYLAKQKGYDGVIIKNVKDNPNTEVSGLSDVYVPFRSEQIRSATGDPQMAGLLDQPAQSVSSSLLDDIVKKAQDKKIDLQVAETDSLIDVGLIKVPKRGKGLGTETMQELTEYADRTGKPIRLIPDPNIAKNVDPERLVSFYERLGFVKQEPVTSQAESGSTFRQFAPTYWVYTPK